MSKLNVHEQVLLFKTLDDKRIFFEGKRPDLAKEYSELIIKLYKTLERGKGRTLR